MKNISISHLNLTAHQNEIITALFQNFEKEEQLISQLEKYNEWKEISSGYDYHKSYDDEKLLEEDLDYDFILRLLYSRIDERYCQIPESLHCSSGDIIPNISDDFDKKYSELLKLMNDDYELITAEIDI